MTYDFVLTKPHRLLRHHFRYTGRFCQVENKSTTVWSIPMPRFVSDVSWALAQSGSMRINWFCLASAELAGVVIYHLCKFCLVKGQKNWPCSWKVDRDWFCRGDSIDSEDGESKMSSYIAFASTVIEYSHPWYNTGTAMQSLCSSLSWFTNINSIAYLHAFVCLTLVFVPRYLFIF